MAHTALNAVKRKKLIFTVTAGRTGTQYLAHLLGLLPDATALHEPDPNYGRVMRAAIDDPGIARAFYLQIKLPQMAAAPGRIYAETSHLFCKGFFVPLLQLGLRPSLIFLRRQPREVALSFLARNTIPARTALGNAYVFHPDDANVLAIPGWERLTNYQLCFWYALAIERRQMRYWEFARTLGLQLYDTTAEELHDFATFTDMASALGAPCGPAAEAGHAQVSAARHNTNAVSLATVKGIVAQEAEVWERVSSAEPVLQSLLAMRYGTWVPETKPKHVHAA